MLFGDANKGKASPKTVFIFDRACLGRLFCAENGDFMKFYTNFTKNLVTFWVLLRLLSVEAGV